MLGGGVQTAGDAVLLPLQHIEGDGVFVVSLEELALLVLELVAGGGGASRRTLLLCPFDSA